MSESDHNFLLAMLAILLLCEGICWSGQWREGWQYRLAIWFSGMSLGAIFVYLWKGVK